MKPEPNFNQERINRAVRGLKHCGPFHYRLGDEPNRLDCSLAGRVSHVFLTGMATAIQMCRDAGEDPEHREPQHPVCCNCPEDADCIDKDGDYHCVECCPHEECDEVCYPDPEGD